MEKNEEFTAHLLGNSLSSNSKKAYTFLKDNFLGEMRNDKVFYSVYEGLFMLRKKGMKIVCGKKQLNENEAIQKFSRIEKNFLLKSKIYEDLRLKGMVLKSGMKYGADFSVYEKGKKPGRDHSSWLLSAEKSSDQLKIKDFILKNRVANSTKKKTILAIENGEGDMIYYEVIWKRF